MDEVFEALADPTRGALLDVGPHPLSGLKTLLDTGEPLRIG